MLWAYGITGMSTGTNDNGFYGSHYLAYGRQSSKASPHTSKLLKQKAHHVEVIMHVLVFKYRHELLPSTPPVSYHTVQFVVTLGHCSAPNKPLSQPMVQAVQLASSELPA